MAVYIWTGKLGAGKTLSAVARAHDYMREGRRVATNVELYLENALPSRMDKPLCTLLPGKPSLDDLQSIGSGNETYDEARNGLLLLDECGTWFNARNWNDPTRRPVLNWFLHARKFGWDVILVVQDLQLLDSQARDALAEHVVYCKRLDRLRVPIIGGIVHTLTGINLRLPKIHAATVRYGTTEQAPISERFFYRGSDYYRSYDTKQVFVDRDAGQTWGPASMLTPWHLRGRYEVPRSLDWFVKCLFLSACFLVLVLLLESTPGPKGRGCKQPATPKLDESRRIFRLIWDRRKIQKPVRRRIPAPASVGGFSRASS